MTLVDGQTTALRVPSWVAAARKSLLNRRIRAGWGYRTESTPCVEPTVLASLALMGEASDPSISSASLEASAEWLVRRQHKDGAVPNSRNAGQWATPYAILLWHAVGGYHRARRRAVDWLLARRGRTFPRDPQGPIGHDTSLVGWPWIDDTHSWLEPTALAVLALHREGLSNHARTQEGLRLILDRAIPSGGWNYGNNVVFGRPLRPRPAPTGIALLALAAAQAQHALVERACRYLQRELPAIRSPQSLCWGLLGLGAWARRPDTADQWLNEAFQRGQSRGDGPCQTAYLLLAAATHALPAFGIEQKGQA